MTGSIGLIPIDRNHERPGTTGFIGTTRTKNWDKEAFSRYSRQNLTREHSQKSLANLGLPSIFSVFLRNPVDRRLLEYPALHPLEP
jgi:hypothetical protein